MEKNAAIEKINSLEAMVSALTELLTVQEKVVGEQSERIRNDEIALKESNERFFTFIKEAAMRLKNPIELVEENITIVLGDIESGSFDNNEVALQLRIQTRNLEQIRQNIIELNRAILEHSGNLSEASVKFLME